MLGLDGSQLASLSRIVLDLGAVGVFVMGIDKLAAKSGSYRFSERFLWLLAIAGGSLGVVLGGVLFHHKTHKPGFWVPVAIAVVLWGAMVLTIWL